MRRKKYIVFLLTAALVITAAFGAMAQVPTSITYQGRLTNASGSPITGTITVVFTIYDNETADTPVWSESQSIDPDDKGVFTVQLGAVTPLDNKIFNGAAKWLGIQIGSDAEMTPLQPINSAPYSITGAGGGSFTLGSSVQDGGLDLYGAAIISSLVHAGRGASGGILRLSDTLGNDAAVLGGEANGAGILRLYRSPGSIGLFAGSIGSEPLLAIQGSSDDVTFNLGITGNASVLFPDNSISSSEILNEPGIARGYASGGTIATSGVTSLLARAITVPGPGYVVASAYAYGTVLGTTIGNIIMGIDTTNSNSSPAGNNYAVFGSNNETVSASATRWGSMAAERTFAVSGAGSVTYYVNASRGYNGGTGYIYNISLMLTYYPTSYGAVSSVAMAKDAAQFEQATPLSVGDDAALAVPTGTDLYLVDLRELELKAAKAQAEAERAQKELLQALIKQHMETINNNPGPK
jgi:hypothetical protein